MTARDRAIKKWSRGNVIVAWMLRSGFVPITREDIWTSRAHPMAGASLCILRSSAKFLTFCATPAELSRIPLIVQGRPTCRSTPLLAAPAPPAPPSTERRHGSNYGIEGPCACSFFAS
jgi:hypothetical protein